MTCSVEVNIRANAETVWGLLTDAKGGFGPIFKGVRTFMLRRRKDNSTDFSMEERFSGLMMPLVKGSLPDLGRVFERYGNDLKREAERAT